MADQKQGDGSNDLLVMLVLLVGALVGIWYFFGTQITYWYLIIKLKQLQILNFIYTTDTFTEYIKFIQERKVTDWTIKEVMFVGGKVGYIINIPMFAIGAWLSYQVWEKNPLQKFKRILTMQSLKESEQRIWPYIAPMVKLDLMKESFSSGPFGMAMRPYDFAVKYHLLLEEKNVNSLDRKKAEKLFISQLGKPWSGFKRLRKHEQALLAIFAAHGCGDKKGAMNAINQMALSAAEINDIKKMPDFSSVKPLFKYVEDPRVQEVLKKHGYVFTAMAQMLEFSRITGVFPPSYFIWLKPRDRSLFYILNCVGRQVSFIEVAGIFGHWRAEQTAKHKLDAPYVIKAVDGLERALGEVKIV